MHRRRPKDCLSSYFRDCTSCCTSFNDRPRVSTLLMTTNSIMSLYYKEGQVLWLFRCTHPDDIFAFLFCCCGSVSIKLQFYFICAKSLDDGVGKTPIVGLTRRLPSFAQQWRADWGKIDANKIKMVLPLKVICKKLHNNCKYKIQSTFVYTQLLWQKNIKKEYFQRNKQANKKHRHTKNN